VLTSGDFKITDSVTGKTIRTLSEAKSSLDYFSPDRTPMLNEETYYSLGSGSDNVHVILNPLKNRSQLKLIFDHFNNIENASSKYQARLVFLGMNDPEMGYGVSLICDPSNIKNKTLKSKDDLCQTGLLKMSKMYVMGIMYDFDKMQAQFPIVIKDGKIHRNANLLDYIN